MRRFKNLRIAWVFLCATLAPTVRASQMMSLVNLLIPRFPNSCSSTRSVQVLVCQQPDGSQRSSVRLFLSMRMNYLKCPLSGAVIRGELYTSIANQPILAHRCAKLRLSINIMLCIMWACKHHNHVRMLTPLHSPQHCSEQYSLTELLSRLYNKKYTVLCTAVCLNNAVTSKLSTPQCTEAFFFAAHADLNYIRTHLTIIYTCIIIIVSLL